jgi:hypothetical protein
LAIEIPASVTILDESSFEGCTELESCWIAEDSSLVSIGVRAFANCTSLRSFSIPRHVGEIGKSCFCECLYLYEIRFGSSEYLKKIVRDLSLDNVLDRLGVSGSSGVFRIEVSEGGEELDFPGWVSLDDGEGYLQLTLVRDFQ